MRIPLRLLCHMLLPNSGAMGSQGSVFQTFSSRLMARNIVSCSFIRSFGLLHVVQSFGLWSNDKYETGSRAADGNYITLQQCRTAQVCGINDNINNTHT